MKKRVKDLSESQKVQGLNRSISFLLRKYYHSISLSPPLQQNYLYTQLLQATFDYWFGKNVYKILRASFNGESRSLSYEAKKSIAENILISGVIKK